MKHVLWIKTLVIVSLMLASALCWANDPAREFFTALQAYQAGDYGRAADRFEAIVQNGIRSGPLFYNLGNAYLKDRQLGPAILWYERARLLIPNDPDLRFNLQYARSLAKDAPEPSTASLRNVFFFWNAYFGEFTAMLLAIGFNGLFWLLLGVWYITRRRVWVGAFLGAAAVTLIFAVTACINLYAAKHPSQGIVLPDQVPIRSGLEDSSTELFLLHAGAGVKVLDRRGEHFLVRFTSEKIGWVRQKSIGLVY